MKTLRSRLARIERRRAVESPKESMADARWKWPGRFASHCPENAALLDKLQAWKQSLYSAPPVPYSDINVWDMVGTLAFDAGAGKRDGQVGYEPNPDENEKIAIGLIEELIEAANRFESETGWEMPLPRPC